MIKAVLFDLDDTLFDHRGCAREALTAVHQSDERLRALPFAAFEERHTTFLEALHADVMLGRMPIEVARRERFRRLLGVAGGSPEAAAATAIAALYRDTYRAVRRAIAGAAALLGAIEPHASIAIVSNNLLEEQQDKLKTCGLDRFVDVLVVSEEAGVSKPDPAIFHIALERLRVLPADAVMVGDSWQADIEGALAAGVHAIWFNPLRTPAPPGDAEVAELASLEPADAVARLILDTHRD